MERLLKRREAAEWLQKPESWFRYAERQRLIPFIKVGHQIRYSVSDLKAWLEARRVVAK